MFSRSSGRPFHKSHSIEPGRHQRYGQRGRERPLRFSYTLRRDADTSGGDVQRNAPAPAPAQCPSLLPAGDYGMAGPSLDRFQSIEGDRYRPADASASLDADGPSSVFTLQPDTKSSLPAGAFAWHVAAAQQTPSPSSVRRGAQRRCPRQSPATAPVQRTRTCWPPYRKATRFRARHCASAEMRSQALPQRHNDHPFRVRASAQATTRSAFARHV